VTFVATLTLSVGLAMDATAVSAARGLSAPRLLPRHVLLVGTLFGGFQAFMPLLGFLVGTRLGPMIAAWNAWIAFLLLALVGGKMLLEARALRDEPPPSGRDTFGLRSLLVLAVATSLDAFAIGVTLPMLKAPLVTSLATIGITTALLSAAGLFAGRRFGSLLGPRLDAVGGLVLIGLGAKILAEHLLSS
jgi:putative Mn2+ efflux pump MntP